VSVGWVGCEVHKFGDFSSCQRRGFQTNQEKFNIWQHPVSAGSAKTGCSVAVVSQTFSPGRIRCAPESGAAGWKRERMLAKELADQASLKTRLPFAERTGRSHSILASGAVCTRASRLPTRGIPGIIGAFRLYKVSNALSSFYEWLSPRLARFDRILAKLAQFFMMNPKLSSLTRPRRGLAWCSLMSSQYEVVVQFLRVGPRHR